MIYKLLPTADWVAARDAGSYPGSDVDRRDGFVHLSGADQVVETASRYFAGRHDLTLLAVDPARLGDDLRWEPSHGGDLFPHLYAALPSAAVVAAYPLPGGDVPHAVAAVLARADR
ncbi:MAG TPA: DUF952 domain-containing protein [Catenuloplanes sp.]